jgi:phosphate-selective porin OprO/OprP
MSLGRLLTASSLLVLALPSCSAKSYGQQLNAYPVGFRTFQEEETDKPDTSLEEQLAEMKIRLEELEFDVKKKLSESKKSKAKSTETTSLFAERLEELEEAVDDHDESIADIDGQIPGFVVSGHKKPAMRFFGRIHLDWWTFPEAEPGIEALEGEDPRDRVAFRRLRIGVSGDLNDNMFYKYEGEFAPGNDPSYRDAFIGFKNSALFNTIIVGNHKRPYGLDQLNSSNHNIFIERPFVNDGFNENNRRLGISSNGFNESKSLNWRYGIWHHALTQESAGFISDHYQPEIAGRLAYMPWYDESSGGRGYLHLAASGSWAWPDGSTAGPDNASRYRAFGEARHRTRWLDTGRILGADTSNLFGLEAVFNSGAFQLTGEYLTVGVNRLDSIGENLRLDGGYVQAAYMLTGEHMPWKRETGQLGRVQPFENFFSIRERDNSVKRGLGAWQVAARYSWADFTDQDIIGGQADALTLATNWHWNARARMQFNYIYGEINRPPTTDIGGKYQSIGTRFMVDF